MPPTFYFAIGARPRRRDLDVALSAGQRHFLVPAGSTAIPWLRHRPGVRVALDSAAWPPDNPNRPTLVAYAQAICAWRLPDGSWGNLDWAASYDHIGNPLATHRDHARLLDLLWASGAGDAPIAASVQYPENAGAAILRAPERAGIRDAAPDRPRFGIGGLVPVLRPTQPRAVFQEADAWFDTLLDDLNTAVDAGADPERSACTCSESGGRASSCARRSSSAATQAARRRWRCTVGRRSHLATPRPTGSAPRSCRPRARPAWPTG